MEARPYLSVVVTSRNDDHGGSMLRRMQTFVNALLAQCRRFALPAELVVVEWNPPAGRPPLSEALNWPADTGPCSVRFLQVPEALHRLHRHADALPLFQMIAKNVGIRRARGEYVLATNIDILLNDHLVRFLAERRLQPGKMYRIDRHDVDTFVPVDAPVEEQLEYCRTHLLRVNARGVTMPVTPTGLPVCLSDDITPPGDSIRLGAGWYPTEKAGDRTYRWIGATADVIVTRDPSTAPVLAIEGELFNDGTLLEGSASLHGPDGDCIGTVPLAGRETIYFTLPTGTAEARYRLRIDGPEITFPLDPRALRYLVHRCYRADAVPADARPGEGRASVRPFTDTECGPVGPPEGGLEFSYRWFPLEAAAGEKFRWFGDRARLRVRRPSPEQRVLNLVIEPGPAVRWGRAVLSVRDIDRNAVRTIELAAGRQLISLAVDHDLIEWEFDIVNAGHRAGADPRLLNARILYAEWSAAPRPIQRKVQTLLGQARRVARRLKATIAQPQPHYFGHKALTPGTAGDSGPSHGGLAPPPFPPEGVDRPVELHTNACGDFTLMHRQHWLDIRGYPEFDIFSMNIDSLGCYQAHHAGAVEEVLAEPMRIYHIEHGVGSGWTPEGEKRLRERLGKTGVPWMESHEVLRLGTLMRRYDSTILFNKEDWGLGGHQLREQAVVGGAAGARRQAA